MEKIKDNPWATGTHPTIRKREREALAGYTEPSWLKKFSEKYLQWRQKEQKRAK